MGAPTICTPEVIKQAEVLCEEFKATDLQLAKALDVAPQTIDNWKENKPAFREATIRGREKQTKRVVKALYERAVGYKHPAKKIMQWQGEPVVVEYEEQYPPDVQAIQFWLKNCDPENWKDVSRSEITGADGMPFPIINITLKAPGEK